MEMHHTPNIWAFGEQRKMERIEFCSFLPSTAKSLSILGDQEQVPRPYEPLCTWGYQKTFAVTRVNYDDRYISGRLPWFVQVLQEQESNAGRNAHQRVAQPYEKMHNAPKFTTNNRRVPYALL